MHVEPVGLVERRQFAESSVDRVDAVRVMDGLDVYLDRSA
jgi:hypothetical protein